MIINEWREWVERISFLKFQLSVCIASLESCYVVSYSIGGVASVLQIFYFKILQLRADASLQLKRQFYLANLYVMRSL